MTEVKRNFDNFARLEATHGFHLKSPVSLPTEKDYHIFIAYTEEDREFALRLDNLLQDKGYKCFLFDASPGTWEFDFYPFLKRSVRSVILVSKYYKDGTIIESVGSMLLMESIRQGNNPIILKLDEYITPKQFMPIISLQADGPLEKWIGTLLAAINHYTRQTGKLVVTGNNLRYICIKR